MISTGGSAVYSTKAMSHLGDIGARVYLNISMTMLTQRVNNIGSRGLAKMKSHSLPRLYLEREPMYRAAADIVVLNNRPISAMSMDALNTQIDLFFAEHSSVDKPSFAGSSAA